MGEELLLGDAIHIVVTQNVIQRPIEASQTLLDGVQVTERKLRRTLRIHILQVAKLDDEIYLRAVEGLDSLIHLLQRVGIVARARCRAVGIVGVGQNAKA